MDANFFSKLKTSFQESVSSPLPFLEGSVTAAEDFKLICKDIYDTSKIVCGKASDPLPTLVVDGFDNEQIWQEIELFNKKEAVTCLKAAEILASKKDTDVFLSHSLEDFDVKDAVEKIENDSDFDEEDMLNDDNEDADSEEDGFQFEESDADEEELSEMTDNYEKTEVDDDFFSLRKMEKFLDEQDRKYEIEMKKPSEGDIDYFEDVPSSDDLASSDDDELQSTTKKSSRHLKYAEYFDAPFSMLKHNSNVEFVSENSEELHDSAEKISDKIHSNFEKHQKQIAKKIEILEDKALAPAEWQMKGEVKASSRPENSLLEETLQFDHVARPPTEITEEHTKDLESLIKQRIIDTAWDDVEKKYKPEADPAEYKKRIVLDSSQSKLSLGEIYEKEYLEKKQKLESKETVEKETEEHVAIRKDMNDLFRKLDALSNFHFISPPPEPEIKLISNVRSLEREEVQPVTHAKSNTLAPEEVFAKSGGGEEKSSLEKSSMDKKRDRRKKKLRMKIRAKARLEKLKKLDPESEKIKSLEAIDELKKAAKAPGSNTTILKSTAKRDTKMTSKRFFSKLQDNGITANNKKKKL